MSQSLTNLTLRILLYVQLKGYTTSLKIKYNVIFDHITAQTYYRLYEIYKYLLIDYLLSYKNRSIKNQSHL